MPWLQESRSAVDAQASELLERARRLFHQYHAGLDRKAQVLDQLRDSEIDVDVRDRQRLLETAEEEYRNYHTELWALFPPTDWPSGGEDKPRPARASYGNLERQIGDGISARKSLLEANRKLLEEALAAVGQALAVRRGEVSASTHAEALRLKAALLYHLGMREQIRGQIARADAEPLLHKLKGLASEAAASAPLTSVVKDSGVEDRIGEVRATIQEAEKQLEKNRASLARLESKVKELESQKTAALARLEETREALDALRAAGVDFTRHDGVEHFAAQVTEKDRAFRQAMRNLHRIQFGDYADARIDDSDDFILGQYVAPDGSTGSTMEYGLSHYQHARTAQTAMVRAAEQAMDGLHGYVARLEAQRNANQATEDRAVAQVSRVQTESKESFEAWTALDSKARALEDEALKLLDQSATQARQAVNATNQWLQSAREKTQSLAAAAALSAFDKQQKSRWMSAYTAAQEADARLAVASVQAVRYQSAEAAGAVLADAAGLLGLDEDVAQEQETAAQEAHDAGVEAVNQTLAILEKVHAEVGKHWTVTSQQAAAVYLLALLGHPSFLDDAVEAYRLAVKGREDKPHAQRIVSRLKQLEARKR